MQPFEFVIKRRPLSQQANSTRAGKKRLKEWKTLVRQEAEICWTSSHQQADGPVCVTLICLFDGSPDIDNVIKPILDSLIGLVYSDDCKITDIIARKRKPYGEFDLSRISPTLLEGFDHGGEFTYIHIADAPPQGTLV